MTGRATRVGPVVEAVVTLVRATGTYDVVSLAVPTEPAWERARPGQLLVLPGDPADGRLLPRVLWVAGVDVDPVHGTTVDVVEPAGHGLDPGRTVRVIGPVGRGFQLPATAVPVLLVGQEQSVVPLRWLLSLLRERSCPSHLVLAASDPDRHLDLAMLRRHATSLLLTTPEQVGAVVTERLGAGDTDQDPALVLATGPRELTGLVARIATGLGRAVLVAALDPDEGVVCGTGLCGQCDLSLDDGTGARPVRVCLQGPVVPGEWWVHAPG